MPYVGLVVLTLGTLAFLGWLVGWLVRRDRRVLRRETDAELGEIQFTRYEWTCARPVALSGMSVKLSGAAAGPGISESQRKTVKFLRNELSALVPKAIASGKKHLGESHAGEDVDLVLESVPVLESEGCFELWFGSPSNPNPIPWGLIVEFSSGKVVSVEAMH